MLESRKMWALLVIKAMKASPVEFGEDFESFEEPTSLASQMLTTLFQAVMVSTMSLMLLYLIAYFKSRALSRGSPIATTEQRMFRLDQHPATMARYVCQTQPQEEESSKRRKIADLESIPLWQVPKVKSHRTNH